MEVDKEFEEWAEMMMLNPTEKRIAMMGWFAKALVDKPKLEELQNIYDARDAQYGIDNY